MQNPFRYFNNSPEMIRVRVMSYMRYPLSLRQLEGNLSQTACIPWAILACCEVYRARLVE
jgi:hypothetical protein